MSLINRVVIFPVRVVIRSWLILLGLVCLGSGDPALRNQPVEITADGGLVVDLRRGLGRARGNVVIRRPDLVVCCREAEASYASGRVTSFSCRGDVIINLQHGGRITAAQAEFRATAERLTLSGDVVVDRAEGRLSGPKLEYDIREDRLQMSGPGSALRLTPEAGKGSGANTIRAPLPRAGPFCSRHGWGEPFASDRTTTGLGPSTAFGPGVAVTLRAFGLIKRYGARRVVDRVDIEVAPNEIVGLLGPNGAGKTTTFRMLAGLVRSDGGTVTLDGVDVSREPLHRRARRGLGYLPQAPSVFRGLTVRGNLIAVLELQAGLSRPEIQRRSSESLERFGLTTCADQPADRLSGGERRRLELARCLAVDPRWVLLDEPFSGIDPIGVRDMQARLRGLRSTKRSILLTDHLVQAALPLCDRAYLIEAGRVVEQGTCAELARSESARSRYLGPDFRIDADGR